MSNPLLAANGADPLYLLIGRRPIHAPSPIAVSNADSYFLRSSQTGSVTGNFHNDGFVSGGNDAGLIRESQCGLSRPDFRQGTVELYERHVFLCYKDPQAWPPRIEAAEFDRLPRLLAAALAARKPDMKRQTRLTICEGHDGTETSNGDVLIFPDMIRYRRLTHFDVDTFVDEVLVKNGEWLPGNPEALMGWYVFVCCHGSRFRRCGVCGPSVVRKFKHEIDLRGLQEKVTVSPCSHIGEHKYAGNVIVFGPNIEKVVTGHWYGYVTKEDVPVLLEQHIGKGEIVDSLWRGQMGLSEEDQIKSQELRLHVYGGINTNKSPKNSTQLNEKNASMCASQANSPQCCNGDGSFSCCQNPTSQETRRCFDSTEVVVKNSAVEKMRKVSRNNSGKGNGARKLCSMPTWYEQWEREDTYAAFAVVGAVLSVAFAYRCYKQLT